MLFIDKQCRVMLKVNPLQEIDNFQDPERKKISMVTASLKISSKFMRVQTTL